MTERFVLVMATMHVAAILFLFCTSATVVAATSVHANADSNSDAEPVVSLAVFKQLETRVMMLEDYIARLNATHSSHTSDIARLDHKVNVLALSNKSGMHAFMHVALFLVD